MSWISSLLRPFYGHACFPYRRSMYEYKAAFSFSLVKAYIYIYIWQFAVTPDLVPTLCRAVGVGTRFYKINLAQGCPAQGPYVLFSYLCMKSGTRSCSPPRHKVMFALFFMMWHKVRTRFQATYSGLKELRQAAI